MRRATKTNGQIVYFHFLICVKFIAAFCLVLGLSSCDESRPTNGLALNLPEKVRTIQDIQYTNLYATISINGGTAQRIDFDNRDPASVAASDFVREQNNTILITWYENFQGSTLELGRQEGSFFLDSQTRTLNTAGYAFTHTADEDGDGDSNYRERALIGTCPLTICPEPVSVLNLPGLSVFGTDLLNADLTEITEQVSITIIGNSIDATGLLFVSTNRYPSYSLTLRDEMDYRLGQWENEKCAMLDFSGSAAISGSRVNAGESIVVNNPSGPMFTINRNSNLSYSSTEVPGQFPPGSSLSIPGADFPSVAAFPLVVPIAPTGLSVDADRKITWVADEDPTSDAMLYFSEHDDNGALTRQSIRCQVKDDGEFTLPVDNALSFALSTDNFRVRIARVIRRIDIIDGIGFTQIYTLGGEPSIPF